MVELKELSKIIRVRLSSVDKKGKKVTNNAKTRLSQKRDEWRCQIFGILLSENKIYCETENGELGTEYLVNIEDYEKVKKVVIALNSLKTLKQIIDRRQEAQSKIMTR